MSWKFLMNMAHSWSQV
jgi:hypothetical protein